MEASVISLRDFSISFKNLNKERNVVRENLIGEIEEFTRKGYKVIIIEGNEGSGKTNLLQQFSQKYNQSSFTYFINSSCSPTYKQDYLMEDLGKQLFFYIKSEIPDDYLSISEADYNKLLFELLKLNNKRNNNPIYFIIDGLDQIERSNFDLLKSTIMSLPWNVNNVHFILSGDTKKLLNLLSIPNTNVKSIWTTRFTFEECCSFFEVQNDEDKKNLRGIYDTWKGHPEDLRQI